MQNHRLFAVHPLGLIAKFGRSSPHAKFAVTLSVHTARCRLVEKISTSGNMYLILLLEVLDVCSWHPKKYHDVCIDFNSSCLIERQCVSAYRVDIGSCKSGTCGLISHCENLTMSH